ncbi:uncharacterized protein EV422DRAFT_119903 [Fimicolochytrium jonesii]|uniref:uncharacterized protein n=1 Tax=Fimicolochytrium jonesii TaxID=1396493 RepID=UPI0022FEEA80|nr:uncharacterized protein EV422DRAFT_119903 [Fimicolochytrium jonesii]KAI8819163.1 hypothetical protein EV422DRAFT_119903 [Fimicolochytrium jonesii]
MSAFDFYPPGTGDAKFMSLNGLPNLIGCPNPQTLMYGQQPAQSMLYPPPALYTNYPWTHHTLQPPVLTFFPTSAPTSAPSPWPEAPSDVEIEQLLISSPPPPPVNPAQGLPESYVRDKLRSLGTQLWGDVSSCDCWVFVETRRSSHDAGPSASANRPPTKKPTHFSMTADGLNPPMPRPKKPAEDFVSVHGKLYRVVPSAQRKVEEEQQRQMRPLTLPTILPVHSIFLTTFSPVLGKLVHDEQRAKQAKSLPAPTSGMYQQSVPTSGYAVTEDGFQPPHTITVQPPSPDAFAILLHWIYTGNVDAMQAFLTNSEGAVLAVLANMEWIGLRDSELAALCESVQRSMELEL